MFFYIIIIIIIVIIIIFIIYVYNIEDLAEGDHMEDVVLLKDILYFTFVEKIRVLILIPENYIIYTLYNVRNS